MLEASETLLCPENFSFPPSIFISYTQSVSSPFNLSIIFSESKFLKPQEVKHGKIVEERELFRKFLHGVSSLSLCFIKSFKYHWHCQQQREAGETTTMWLPLSFPRASRFIYFFSLKDIKDEENTLLKIIFAFISSCVCEKFKIFLWRHRKKAEEEEEKRIFHLHVGLTSCAYGFREMR